MRLQTESQMQELFNSEAKNLKEQKEVQDDQWQQQEGKKEHPYNRGQGQQHLLQQKKMKEEAAQLQQEEKELNEEEALQVDYAPLLFTFNVR